MFRLHLCISWVTQQHNHQGYGIWDHQTSRVCEYNAIFMRELLEASEVAVLQLGKPAILRVGKPEKITSSEFGSLGYQNGKAAAQRWSWKPWNVDNVCQFNCYSPLNCWFFKLISLETLYSEAKCGTSLPWILEYGVFLPGLGWKKSPKHSNSNRQKVRWHLCPILAVVRVLFLFLLAGKKLHFIFYALPFNSPVFEFPECEEFLL